MTKCRPATDEEKQASAARCDRCQIRGFKNCNGLTPCDVCTRNNTVNACRRARKRNPPGSHRSDEATPAYEPGISKPKGRTGPVEQASKDVSQHISLQTATAEIGKTRPPSAKRSRKTIARRSSVPLAHATSDNGVKNKSSSAVRPSKRRKVETDIVADDLEEDGRMDLDELLQASAQRYCSPSPPSPYGALETTPEAAAKDDHVFDGMEDDAQIDSAEATSNSALESSVVGKSASTDDTSATEEDEPRPISPKPKHAKGSSPKAGTRQRRSQGRVSYAEVFPDVLSDDEPPISGASDDSASDVYSDAASSTDTDDAAEPMDFNDDQTSASEEDVSGEEEAEEEDNHLVDDVPTKSKPKSNTKKGPVKAKEGKGIDRSLPPLHDIEEIFADMAAKAIRLKLPDALQTLKDRPIHVATMCSGTESPILALELLSKGLEKAGLSPIKFQHHFSAEIEVMKQTYIERNFSPPLIFRDVRDFIPEDSSTAITAYGAEVLIPSGLDILIAGFVCKDLSQLNGQRKGLDDDGESGDTFRALHSITKKTRPRIVLIENVKSTKKMWRSVVSKLDEIEYEATFEFCDTKRYYLPQTRERMYMIAVDRRQYGDEARQIVEQWRDSMQKLRRQCSSPYEAFLTKMQQDPTEHKALISEPDWSLCKLRYDHIRSDERLGILRPVTRWNENGTVR
jgi:hypothetical protein